MMLSAVLCAAVVVAPAARSREETPPKDAVLLMPLSSLGSTQEAVEAVERVLTHELASLLGSRLAKWSTVAEKQPKAATLVERCEGSTDCLLEVFGALGWQNFIVGNMSGLGEDRVINLRLLSPRQGGLVNQASEKASGEERELISNMRKAAVLLVARERYVGTLEFNTRQSGLTVSVDGEVVGVTPLAPPRREVPAGRRAVEASGEGLVSFSSMVDVGYGEVVPLTIFLPDNTVFVGGRTPFRSRWYTWAVAGVGVVGMALGGYFHYLHAQNAGDLEDLAKQGRLTASQHDEYKSWKQNLKTARVFYGGGGAVLGVVGFSLAWDLF